MVGFNVQNKNVLESRFICPTCSFLLREPVQLVCGHRYCRSCVDNQSEAMIKCVECHEETPPNKRMFDRGFKNDMSSLIILCEICNWTGTLKNYQDHLDRCHSHPLCGSCGERFPSMDLLDQHKLFVCSKTNICCPLRWCGYNSLIRERTMREHYLSTQHQRALLNGLVQCMPKLNDNSFRPDLVDLSSTKTSVVATITSQVRLLSELARSVQSIEEQLSTTKNEMEEQNNFLTEVMCKHECLRGDLVLIKSKIEQMAKVFVNGMFIWKVTNFRQNLFADNHSEQAIGIDSQHFYSSNSGYKMGVRLYPNGNGSARHKFMSLFFSLLPGEYDDMLKWPFDFRVTFCLYDQSGEQKHIIKSFRCDTKSNSFQRPKSSTRISMGIPEFVPLTMFENHDNPYIRDDTIFIQVMINDYTVPPQLLPRILDIDPALPTSIREEIIQKMIDCCSYKLVLNFKHLGT